MGWGFLLYLEESEEIASNLVPTVRANDGISPAKSILTKLDFENLSGTADRFLHCIVLLNMGFILPTDAVKCNLYHLKTFITSNFS